MVSTLLIKFINENLLNLAIHVVLPTMVLAFMVGCVARVLIFYTVKRHDWFAKEFEKRVQKFIESEDPNKEGHYSFYVITKRIMEKAYYESFEVRDRIQRRKNDKIMAVSDRIFLIKQGTAWLIRDLLKQLKFLKWNDQNPKLLNITKTTFQQNPCFNKVFGIIPISYLHDMVQILPALFVIGGIFGTFLGIVKGLPTLGQMDLANMELSKTIMDSFLVEISFAMNSSIIGIFLSVMMTIVNTAFSPEKVYIDIVDRLEGSLDLLWYRSNNNDYPKSGAKFDEHRDPVEALAEQSINDATGDKVRSRDVNSVKSAS